MLGVMRTLQDLVGRSVNEADMPTVLPDLDVIEQDVLAIHNYLSVCGVPWRTHVQAHKSPRLPRFNSSPRDRPTAQPLPDDRGQGTVAGATSVGGKHHRSRSLSATAARQQTPISFVREHCAAAGTPTAPWDSHGLQIAERLTLLRLAIG